MMIQFSALDKVVSLLNGGANQDYIGEDVTQLQHALQCAQAARLRGECHVPQLSASRSVAPGTSLATALGPNACSMYI